VDTVGKTTVASIVDRLGVVVHGASLEVTMTKAVLTLCAIASFATGCVYRQRGVVYADQNGNGVQDQNEAGVAGAVVNFERGTVAMTDADGRFDIVVPSVAPGLFWVRIPSGFRTSPVWRSVSDDRIALPLQPLARDQLQAPVRFVVAADTHMPVHPGDAWDGGDLAAAFAQATLGLDARFFTVVGDLTQGNKASEFADVETAVATLKIPWIPVAGNHDWYDGGAAWREHIGPDNYSFDINELHFVVWDTNLDADEQVDFFKNDLANVSRDTVVIGLGHASPTDEVASELASIGVDYLFTGHWHANRVLRRSGMEEWGTQPLIMAGLDQSPAGYRIVTFNGRIPKVEFRPRLVTPQLALTEPVSGQCVSPISSTIQAAAAFGAEPPRVTARVDCGPERVMHFDEDWKFSLALGTLTTGPHSVKLRSTSPAGDFVERNVGFQVCESKPLAVVDVVPWLQLGGSAQHRNATTATVQFPLQSQWHVILGPSLAMGSPVVADGVIVVTQTDFSSGSRGGLVALHPVNGQTLWRVATEFPIRNAPAIAGQLVIAAQSNGEIIAVGLHDGVVRWHRNISQGLPQHDVNLWSAPTIANNIALFALRDRTVALNVSDGTVAWSTTRKPAGHGMPSTTAAIAVDESMLFANFARGENAEAMSLPTGDVRWAIAHTDVNSVNATPVIANGIVYVISSFGIVTAMQMATGHALWSVWVTPGGFDWGYSAVTTPAVNDKTLVVPTQWGSVVALDIATGAERWHVSPRPGPLNFAHYRSSSASMLASPLITGSLVWLAHQDGKLAAHRLSDGALQWQIDLRTPITTAPIPFGDGLLVTTYDGSVYALRPGAAAPTVEPQQCDAPARGSCSGSNGAVSLWIVALALLFLRRRLNSSTTNDGYPGSDALRAAASTTRVARCSWTICATRNGQADVAASAVVVNVGGAFDKDAKRIANKFP
jgi:outer membrane protein assembly factor BamB